MPIKPNTTYSQSSPKNQLMQAVFFYDANKNFISTIGGTVTTFTTPLNAVYLLARGLYIDTANQWQLEEGTSPTTYTPYAVQVNKKPMKYVPKKNLFDGADMSVLDTNFRYKDVYLNANATYSLSTSVGLGVIVRRISDSADTLNDPNIAKTSRIFTPTTSELYRVFFRIPSVSWTYSNKPQDIQAQLEEGTTATPYEPYTQVLPKARTGLSFNGVTDYFQLPSMTMDSVEIECLIDSVGNTVLMDGRSGLSNGWFYSNATKGTGIKEYYVDGVLNGIIPSKQRTKIKINAVGSFTDDVSIFANYLAQTVSFTKATLYKVTCYLNGAEVARYNFENVNNLVGDKVIPQAKNLIPSFEDARWSLHANTQVLGKDALRLNATANGQNNIIIVDALPNTSYMLKSIPNVDLLRSDGSYIRTWSTSPFTTSSDTSKIKVYLGSASAGTFDFIRPQLYQLDGKEGTLIGTPIQLKKSNKRTLYAKR
jgi:hypothetical protein